MMLSDWEMDFRWKDLMWSNSFKSHVRVGGASKKTETIEEKSTHTSISVCVNAVKAITNPTPTGTSKSEGASSEFKSIHIHGSGKLFATSPQRHNRGREECERKGTPVFCANLPFVYVNVHVFSYIHSLISILLQKCEHSKQCLICSSPKCVNVLSLLKS